MESARRADLVGGGLNAVANMLRAYGGRPTQRRESSEDRLLELRRRGRTEDRLDQQRTDRLSAQQQAQQLRQQQQESTQDLARQRLAIAEQNAATQRMGMESLVGRREAMTEQGQPRLAQLRAQLEQYEAMHDPGSTLSQTERERFRGELAAMPEAAREQVERLLGDVNLDNLSAEQIRQTEQVLGRWGSFRSATHRRGGRGRVGTAGAAADPSRGTAEDPLVREFVRLGGNEAIGMERARNDRQALAREVSRGELGGTVREGQQAARSADQVDRGVQQLGRTLRAGQNYRQAIRDTQQAIQGLSEEELRLAFLGGPTLPANLQRAHSAITGLRARLLQARSGAAVSEPEFERVSRELGTQATASPTVFLRFLQGAAREAQQQERGIRAEYGDDVVRAYEQRLRREGVGGGRQRSTERVYTVRDRLGQEHRIPESRLEEARRRGGVVVDGR